MFLIRKLTNANCSFGKFLNKTHGGQYPIVAIGPSNQSIQICVNNPSSLSSFQTLPSIHLVITAWPSLDYHLVVKLDHDMHHFNSAGQNKMELGLPGCNIPGEEYYIETGQAVITPTAQWGTWFRFPDTRRYPQQLNHSQLLRHFDNDNS